ncbi:MAG: hypothetical protein ACLGHN_00540 [Bacteriovoracia bacterium]
MAQDHIKKEALFNEVKGSLFEYLVGKELSVLGSGELFFQQSLDKNYLTVLSQQDRMVRQFYPDMLPFLNEASKTTARTLIDYLQECPSSAKVVGKFSNSSLSSDLHEADLVLALTDRNLSVSLKLNKKHAFVNTKSGGIKSFFTLYFPFIKKDIQEEFNQFVDMEFFRMGGELHELHDLDFQGNFDGWVRQGLSELPGELDDESREVLKNYYARIAHRMHMILDEAFKKNPSEFLKALPALMGFGGPEILQVVYFHEFPKNENPVINIHSYADLAKELEQVTLKPFSNVSSIEVDVGSWALQIRVKPMNKFTTTAIKINCSVKVKRPSAF